VNPAIPTPSGARLRAAPGQRRSVAGLFRRAADLALAELDSVRWPSTKYQTDPVGFARDILGLELWDRLEEVLNCSSLFMAPPCPPTSRQSS
jgi:hypothetical protein